MKVMAMFSNDEFIPPKDWTYFWCCKHEEFLFEKNNKIVVVGEPMIDLVNSMERECDTVLVEKHPRHPEWKVCVNCLDRTAQQLLDEGSVKNVRTKY